MSGKTIKWTEIGLSKRTVKALTKAGIQLSDYDIYGRWYKRELVRGRTK